MPWMTAGRASEVAATPDIAKKRESPKALLCSLSSYCRWGVRLRGVWLRF